jgi:DNA-binding CsgD family transcriptional regulator
MLKRKINIQQILESSHRSIKWPMILFDLSMGVIAHVGCSRTCLEDKIRNGFVTDTFFHHIMDGENVSEDDGYNNIIRTAEWEGGKVWAGRIKLDGHPIAYLVLYADDADAAKKDIRIFDVLCSLLGLKIQNDWQYLPGITTPENAFLYSILGDTALSAQNIDDRAVRLNLRLYDRLHLIVLESRKDSRHIDELYLFHRKLQTLFPHKYILIKEQRITVLFDSNEAEPIQGELYRDFSRMLKGEGFLAAVGLEFNSLKDMRDNFDQTCICLDIALRAKSKDPIVFHKDLMVEHMLLTCSEHMDLRKTIHPAIAILRDTDSKSKTQLEETLFILIANHMNMAETAKKIHIHYNTLKYRVQRIEELTGLDLKDSNTTFQLSLSRRIMDLLSLFP